MPTRRIVSLLTITQPEQSGAAARDRPNRFHEIRPDYVGYKSQSAILYWIRRRRRRWREAARAGVKNEPLQVQVSLARTPPWVDCHRLLLQVTLSPAAIVISWVRAEFVGGGSGAGNRLG
jgi:hypothetical protein